MPNRLSRETSPYLLQHADNPVDWYPWGEEALTRARIEDKPVLLSIGYSACHWCHVMAHESFDNGEIAEFMNQHFVNIKVDREERPDLDGVYMEAVQALTGVGGWPLTVFLTSDGKPFFGGTYFPPRDRGGMPGFLSVLRSVDDAYRTRRNDVEQSTVQIVAALSRQSPRAGSGEPLTADILDQAYSTLKQSFDSSKGGFGDAPKFPQPMTLEFLMRYFSRTKDGDVWDMIDLTLEKMARGGIYDQLGGGFHRYATDAGWQIPHFEKMLYDNALLSQAYIHAYIISGKQLFATVAAETLSYVLREMTGPQGGFYSTQDADTEGVEGKYYIWTPEEITRLTGEERGRVINEYFGVSEQGNFDGRSVLHVAGSLPENMAGAIQRGREALLKGRERRVRPGRDEKALASWNGLMLSSLAEAACVLDRRDYLNAARANGSFMVNLMVHDGHLRHSYKDGRSTIDGFLQDYASVIEGLLALHQATFEGRWLREGIRLADVMIERFWDETTGVFYDSQKNTELFIRPRSIFDAATPSGPSAATMVLLKLARLMGNSSFERIAAGSLRSVREYMVKYPLGFGNWLCALDFYLSQPKEIVITGPREHPNTLELLRVICNTWLPNKVTAARDPGDREPMTNLGILKDKYMVDDKPTVYVCQQCACQNPVTEAAALAVRLK